MHGMLSSLRGGVKASATTDLVKSGLASTDQGLSVGLSAL